MFMAKQSRSDASGILQHVVGEFIDRHRIFTDPDDYLLFLKFLGD